MADYCKTCSEYIFGADFKDLKGLIKEKEVKEGFGIPALCECCGPIIVNHLGERIGDAEKKCYSGCFDKKNPETDKNSENSQLYNNDGSDEIEL